MKVILIEQDGYFRTMVRKFLQRDLPDAELLEYDPVTRGRPDEAFDWGDLVLLNHELGVEEPGLDWLRWLKQSPRPPPVIYFTRGWSESVDRQARALGADEVLDMELVSGTHLATQICAVLERPSQAETPASSSEASPASGKPIIEGYKVANEIGKGAMSIVYLGERVRDGITVVLKVIDVDLVNHHAEAKRFVEEAELVSGVNSPHVVRIYEQGFSDDHGFIAMEFFPRGDLKQRIEYGIPPGDAVHCLANIAYGLDAIHSVGIVHRDLKPANVMFRHDDSLALADFGISKRMASERGHDRPSTVFGTPHYMSPEQGQGKPADVRNDLYSLGIIFYEMLTGEKPFHAETPARLVYQHIHAELPKLPRKLRRYQGLIDKLLAKDPNDRYQSAAELIDVGLGIGPSPSP